MQTSYNPTTNNLAETIAVLSDTVREPLVITRTIYGYHIETLQSTALYAFADTLEGLYDTLTTL